MGSKHLSIPIKPAEVFDELPLGSIIFWHKSLATRAETKNSTGTATTDTTDKLIDSSATFQTDGVAVGDIVYNSTDGVYATVQSVDSQIQLTLDWDAFPDGNENYDAHDEPSVPQGWIEFSGQTINDQASPFYNMTIPDVIGDERFFRAMETAGRLQNDSFQGHYHDIARGDSTGGSLGVWSTSAATGQDNAQTFPWSASARTSKSDGTNGEPRTANETRPINISVVPLLKIKKVGQLIAGTQGSTSSITTVSSNLTITDDDGVEIVKANTGAPDLTVTLPTAADNPGRKIKVIKNDTGSGKVIVDGEGAETINGTATFNLESQYNYLDLLCDGSGWIILSVKASYDTGWINRSDWTNVHLGSDDTLNTDSNVTHNLNAPLSDIIVKVLISTDGTDANSFEVQYIDHLPGASLQHGITILQVDSNNIIVQVATHGLVYSDSSGTLIWIDTENWYYKIKVWKLG